jgi:hypothetical protein
MYTTTQVFLVMSDIHIVYKTKYKYVHEQHHVAILYVHIDNRNQ